MLQKLFIVLSIFLFFVPPVFATTTSTQTRSVNIDGTVQGQNGAATGTNGGSWESDETRATSTGGADFYLTWDNNNLYVGWVGGIKGQQHIIWIDTDPQPVPTDGAGSISTFNYGNITATLPFSGNFFVNVQDAYNEYRTNTTGTWSGGTSGALTVSASATTNDIEAVIPWNTITNGNGKPSSVYFLSYINDPAGNGNTGAVYANAPSSNTNTGGGNQTFAHYFGQNVNGGVDPFGTVDNSLAVELVSLNADAANGYIDLTWTTESENDNLGFIVLRSENRDDGYRRIAGYSEVAALRGAGSASYRHDYAYKDYSAVMGNRYWYKIVDVDYSGGRTEHGPVSAALEEAPGVLRTSMTVPQRFSLKANYPNPFNTSTVIPFEIARTGDKNPHVKLEIYDIVGKRIAVLLDGVLTPGHYTLRWSGRSNSGLAMPSGVYIYRLSAPGFTRFRRMMLVK